MFKYNGCSFPDDIISKKLKYHRYTRLKTQKQVADYLGVTQTAYSYYESGRCQIDVISFIKLLDWYRLSVGEFLWVDDSE